MITFGGVLLTLCATVWLNYRTSRRDTAFRWVEAKRQLYADFVKACHDLRRLPVWPTDGDPRSILDEIRGPAVEIEIISPARVTEKAMAAVVAAERLVTLIGSIRGESKAGHGDGVVERFRDKHLDAVRELSSAVDEFLASARVDLDVKSRLARPDSQSDRG